MMPQKSENDVMLSAVIVVLDRNFFCLYVGVDELIKSFNQVLINFSEITVHNEISFKC